MGGESLARPKKRKTPETRGRIDLRKDVATRESEEGMGTKGRWVIALLKVNEFNNYLLSIEIRVSNETWSLTSVGSHSPMSERGNVTPNSYFRSHDTEGENLEELSSSPDSWGN